MQARVRRILCSGLLGALVQRQQPPSHSPISVLPPELLAVIFAFAYNTASRNISISLALSSVCRQWRSISHGMSILWSSISISHRDADGHKRRALEIQRPSQRGLLSIGLNRSRPQPLELIVSFESCVNVPELEKMMGFLVDHSCRWRSFQLLGDGEEAMMKALATCRGQVPFLELMRISGLWEWPTTVNLEQVFSGSLPRLYRLELHNLLVLRALPQCHNLHTLELCRVEIDLATLVQIVQTCATCLRQLYLVSIELKKGKGEGQSGEGKFIQLDGVQRLAVIDTPISAICQFLDEIAFPRLEYLRLSYQRESGGVLSCLERFIHHQSPIHTLHIQLPHLPLNEMTTLLRGLHTIRNLYLWAERRRYEASPIAPTLIQELGTPYGSGGERKWLLPNLQRFWPTDLVLPQDMVRLFEHRYAAGCNSLRPRALEEVGVRWSEEWVDVVSACKKLGVRLVDSSQAHLFDPAYDCVGKSMYRDK